MRRHRSSVLVPALGAAVALAPVTSGAAQVTASESPACSTAASEPRRLELPDGRIVSVDFRSFARSGSTIFAAGRHAYVFAADARARTSPALQDSIIGVTIDQRAGVSLVTNPALPRKVFHLRVAPAPDERFHAVWVTGLDSVQQLPGPSDTITLWHAMYDNGTWSAPSRVASLRGVRLEPELGSPLFERDGELALFFPFVDYRSEQSEGGAILLRRLREGWRADTLRTRRPPSMVRALYRPGSVAAVLTFDDSPSGGPDALYFSTFRGSWSRPVKLADHATLATTLPMLSARNGGYAVSWITWQWLSASSSRLEWMLIDSTGRSLGRGRVDAGEATYPYEMAVIDDRHPLWLYRGTPPGRSVALAIGLDSGVARLPSLAVPFSNPVPSTLALGPNRLALFTQKLALTDDEPMAASFVTDVEVRCPGSRQR